MNSKVTTNNYQQINLKEKKTMKTKTKQTTRTGTESEKWTSHGGISMGREKGGMGEKVQGIRNIISRHKLDRGRLRIV